MRLLIYYYTVSNEFGSINYCSLFENGIEAKKKFKNIKKTWGSKPKIVVTKIKETKSK